MSKPIRVAISGMHCASCASVIEKTLNKNPHVKQAEVNFGTEKAKITFNSETIDIAELNKEIEPLGYSLKEDRQTISNGIEKLEELKKMKVNIITIIPLAAISIVIMSWEIFKYSASW